MDDREWINYALCWNLLCPPLVHLWLMYGVLAFHILEFFLSPVVNIWLLLFLSFLVLKFYIIQYYTFKCSCIYFSFCVYVILIVRIDAPIFHNQEGGWIGFDRSCPVLANWNCFDNNFYFWINWNGIVWCLMYGAFVL